MRDKEALAQAVEAGRARVDELETARGELQQLVVTRPSEGGPGAGVDFEEAETLWQCIFSQQSEIISLQEQLKQQQQAVL